jgi:hypothetical protein
VTSRREQKERIRRERQARERAAREAARRRRRLGYAAGGVLGTLALAGIVVAVVAGAGGGGSAGFPGGGQVPERRIFDLEQAARAAGCELKSARIESASHVPESERVKYQTNPPSGGNQTETPAEDGAYADAPDVRAIAHSLEHSRVVYWFRPDVPRDVKADLKALYDEDSYQIVLARNETRMPYAVAASAWNREPGQFGTGRVLGCPRMNERVFDALWAFSDEHRGNGPEAAP